MYEMFAYPFQFLMVRLKGQTEGVRGNPCRISIPYGSIKSAPAFMQADVSYHISIPYGSIKSRCLDASYTIDVQIDN